MPSVLSHYLLYISGNQTSKQWNNCQAHVSLQNTMKTPLQPMFQGSKSYTWHKQQNVPDYIHGRVPETRTCGTMQFKVT